MSPNKNVAPTNSGKSTIERSNSSLIFSLKIATIPRMRNMFVILDPITLPVTISETFFCTAKIEETNSGNDVPNAIIETPIINEGLPRYKPIFSPESVKNWEALIKTNRLKIKIVGHNNNCINFFAFPNNERVICLETT